MKVFCLQKVSVRIPSANESPLALCTKYSPCACPRSPKNGRRRARWECLRTSAKLRRRSKDRKRYNYDPLSIRYLPYRNGHHPAGIGKHLRSYSSSTPCIRRCCAQLLLVCLCCLKCT